MSTRCGFIGLGNMGKAIAGNLAPSGLETIVFDVVDAPVRDLEKGGAHAAKSPGEVGAGADVIGICVPADSHVREVLLGDDGVLAHASAGSVICIHSTIHPNTITEMSDAAKVRGIEVLDVPVAGGAVRVAARDAYFMVGGEESAFEKARPYLEASAGKMTYCGELGNASKLKLAINLHTNASFASVREAVELTKAMGLSQELFEEAGQTIGTVGTMLLSYLSLHKQPKEVIESEQMQGHLRQSLGLGDKDVSLALEMADAGGVDLPVAQRVKEQIGTVYSVKADAKR